MIFTNRPEERSPWAGPAIYFACLCLSLFAILADHEPALAGPMRQEATVTRIHDGDTVTLRMDGKTYRTRLIGIDAPEMGQEPWGKKSRKHLRELLNGSGRMVRVETDITTYDKYNRLLAYLWLDDGTMVNEQMLADGYAVLFTIQPNSKHVERLKKAQYAARENHLAIWGPHGLTEQPIDYKKAHPRK